MLRLCISVATKRASSSSHLPLVVRHGSRRHPRHTWSHEVCWLTTEIRGNKEIFQSLGTTFISMASTGQNPMPCIGRNRIHSPGHMAERTNVSFTRLIDLAPWAVRQSIQPFRLSLRMSARTWLMSKSASCFFHNGKVGNPYIAAGETTAWKSLRRFLKETCLFSNIAR